MDLPEAFRIVVFDGLDFARAVCHFMLHILESNRTLWLVYFYVEPLTFMSAYCDSLFWKQESHEPMVRGFVALVVGWAVVYLVGY